MGASKHNSREPHAGKRQRRRQTQDTVVGYGPSSLARRTRRRIEGSSGAPKLLEELIVEGARVHADTREAAEKVLRGVLGDVQSTLNEICRVSQVRRARLRDAFENLEKMFQTRVHRALNQIGVPSADEVEALSKRVDTLNANIEKLARGPKPARGCKRSRNSERTRLTRHGRVRPPGPPHPDKAGVNDRAAGKTRARKVAGSSRSRWPAAGRWAPFMKSAPCTR